MSLHRERVREHEPPAISQSGLALWLELKPELWLLKAGSFTLMLMLSVPSPRSYLSDLLKTPTVSSM